MIEPGVLKEGERVISLEAPLLTQPDLVCRYGTVLQDTVVRDDRSEVSIHFDGVRHRIIMPVSTIRRLNLVEEIGQLDR